MLSPLGRGVTQDEIPEGQQSAFVAVAPVDLHPEPSDTQPAEGPPQSGCQGMSLSPALHVHSFPPSSNTNIASHSQQGSLCPRCSESNHSPSSL